MSIADDLKICKGSGESGNRLCVLHLILETLQRVRK